MSFFNRHERKKAAAIAAGNGDVVNAHQHSIGNRRELDASLLAACFYCQQTFAPSEISDWVHDEDTALCPRCGIDSVLGDKSGYLIKSPDFLRKMNEFWF